MIPIIYNSSNDLEASKLWKKRISDSLNKIMTTKSGNILIKKIIDMCKNVNHNIKIVSKQLYATSVEYPKITYYKGKADINIVIPESYQSLVTVIDNEILPKHLFDDKSNIIRYLAMICNNTDIDKSLVLSSDIKSKSSKYYEKLNIFTYQQIQPLEIILAHELIHSLRILLDIRSDETEEPATIFGVINKTLIVDRIRITENCIRKELGYPMRVNHEAKVSF